MSEIWASKRFETFEAQMSLVCVPPQSAKIKNLDYPFSLPLVHKFDKIFRHGCMVTKRYVLYLGKWIKLRHTSIVIFLQMTILAIPLIMQAHILDLWKREQMLYQFVRYKLKGEMKDNGMARIWSGTTCQVIFVWYVNSALTLCLVLFGSFENDDKISCIWRHQRVTFILISRDIWLS